MNIIRTIDLWTEQHINHYECFNEQIFMSEITKEANDHTLGIICLKRRSFWSSLHPQFRTNLCSGFDP